MINATSCKITKAIIALHDSNIQFYPCGSRYFKDATDSSDWDFFSDDPAAEAELEKLGFKEVTDKMDYRDINTLAVWTKGKKVHVIIVTSAAARLEVQEDFTGKPKSFRKLTENWNNAYKALGLS